MKKEECKHEVTLFIDRDGDFHDTRMCVACGKIICVKVA
jgi:hypothetical protein